MGQNWAIAIGINNYDNLQALSYAKQDAEAVRDYYRHEIGFEQVYYFAEDAPDIELEHGPPFKPLPTFAKLDRFLDIRFEQPFLHPGDNFWFFFAGHGKRHRDRDYLMPSDVNPRNIEGTAIALNYVTERLRRCGADNVILLLDACRNDGDRDGEGLGLEKQQGVVTLFACSPSERSYEIEALQQGAFTHTLLQGLRLQGEGNCATVERLDQYLRYRVPELNQRYNKPPQTPYANAEPIAKRHLILLPQRATLADVMVLKNDALEAETDRDWELAEQLWVRVLTVSPADQQAIKAIKRIARWVDVDLLSRRELSHPTDSGHKAQIPIVQPASTSSISTFRFEVIKVDAQGQEVNCFFGETQVVSEDLGHGVRLDMVPIPCGSFQMGSPQSEEGRDWYKTVDENRRDPESPQHAVVVSAFLMGKYPVTQAQWQTVAALPRVNQDLNPAPSRFKGTNYPVEKISWHDAIEFCARLSHHTSHKYRLPSEAEWEYACRAESTEPFYFGKTIKTDLANYRGIDKKYRNGTYPGSYGAGPKGIYRQQTTDVGNFPPNAFGLYDMHGNVWEWCLDYWHDTYENAPTNGEAWIENRNAEHRLLRGGSWYRYPWVCRSAFRNRDDPNVRYADIGFRLVCSPA